MKSLKHIRDIINKYKFRYILGIVCLIFVDFLQLVMPKIFGDLTDLFKTGALTKSLRLEYALIIPAVALGIAAFRFLWRYLVFGASKMIEATLKNRFYEHLQKLSVNYYNKHKTGDLMAHATNDINNVSTAMGQGVALAFDSAIIPIVAIIMIFKTVGLWLTLASFAPLVVLAFVIVFVAKTLEERAEKMQESFSQITERARENFSGIRVVKAFVQELKEIKKFETSNTYNKEMNLRYVWVLSTLFPLVMSISSFSFVIALWYGGVQVINGYITLGDFIAFNGYLAMLIWPIAAMGWVVSIFQRGSVSLKRVNAIMDEKPEIVDEEDIEKVNEIQGEIIFKNLTFAYPGTEMTVLKDINISIKKGKTLAVVGRTGSGKTTLISLIQRLYDVNEGTISIDGIGISKIPLTVLRGSMGYVPQDTFLFSTTIKENIDFFKGKDEESIIKTTKTAKVYDNIMEFPDKFETLVGERGVTLSGGQKQRIAIARAILGEPSILLLDDCLSAVDTNTEEEILKGLREVMHQRTTIIVSHRISTIKDADEIIVLDDGEIIERGTHEVLLEIRGTYFDLYQKQLLVDQLEGAE